ncbi:hypothetical protein W97_05080 [Coniosporium apollinis CBS 100218]|uniref:Glycosyl hydrolase family 13 catalytic domain-containing protein n=1 Tax=Coniosporium apollinis (strain CBS 100218) TaxID=1168221 RepID=R7YVG2_CONA1|nr:uncharacterized protein W97_05080 [Coniosporium apollinis CBS 100218]EON65838.1 hypothetical protein W97_05080 [Coniosporium apollinis CBS 100218]
MKVEIDLKRIELLNVFGAKLTPALQWVPNAAMICLLDKPTKLKELHIIIREGHRPVSFDKLIRALDSRGMKFVMDMVVNHTSNQYGWFQAAKKSKDSEFRDFYIWRKPKDDASGEEVEKQQVQ